MFLFCLRRFSFPSGSQVSGKLLQTRVASCYREQADPEKWWYCHKGTQNKTAGAGFQVPTLHFGGYFCAVPQTFGFKMGEEALGGDNRSRVGDGAVFPLHPSSGHCDSIDP